jgi:GT2 family glycosyltransferase
VGMGYKLIRFNQPVCWAKMLNTGAEASTGDWLMLLNDDVLCQGSFANTVERLDAHGLYGPAMRKKNPSWFDVGVRINYLYAWNLVMKKSVFDRIGGFDEWYQKAGVDDIDFCWRAEQLSIPLIAVDFPFIHLEPHRREQWDGYREQMLKSIEYFIGKVKGNKNDI